MYSVLLTRVASIVTALCIGAALAADVWVFYRVSDLVDAHGWQELPLLSVFGLVALAFLPWIATVLQITLWSNWIIRAKRRRKIVKHADRITAR